MTRQKSITSQLPTHHYFRETTSNNIFIQTKSNNTEGGKFWQILCLKIHSNCIGHLSIAIWKSNPFLTMVHAFLAMKITVTYNLFVWVWKTMKWMCSQYPWLPGRDDARSVNKNDIWDLHTYVHMFIVGGQDIHNSGMSCEHKIQIRTVLTIFTRFDTVLSKSAVSCPRVDDPKWETIPLLVCMCPMHNC